MDKNKPTRRDLLVIIDRLQRIIGEAMIALDSDSGPGERVPVVRSALTRAHELCIEAAGYDPPVQSKGPWAT